jgi:hypothetical protein
VFSTAIVWVMPAPPGERFTTTGETVIAAAGAASAANERRRAARERRSNWITGKLSWKLKGQR